jgi:hypothetical protein
VTVYHYVPARQEQPADWEGGGGVTGSKMPHSHGVMDHSTFFKPMSSVLFRLKFDGMGG